MSSGCLHGFTDRNSPQPNFYVTDLCAASQAGGSAGYHDTSYQRGTEIWETEVRGKGKRHENLIT